MKNNNVFLRTEMNLQLNTSVARGYKSRSQIARLITESWVEKNSFCPHCGKTKLERFGNNQPVADFYCRDCSAEY